MSRKSLFAGVAGVLVLVVLVVGFAGWSRIKAERETSVGYVDISRIVREWPQFQTQQQMLVQERDRLEKEYQQKAVNMTNDEKVKLNQQYQTILDQKQIEVQKQLADSVTKAVQLVAEEKGYSTVLDKQAVLYGGKDITSDVLQKLNAGVKK